jgi:hypothetical protein
MKRSVIIVLLAFTAVAHAWDFSGNNQVNGWSAQPGYQLSYKEYCDLRLAGGLKKDIGIEAGLRFLIDQETWDDAAMFRGFSKRYIQVKTGDMAVRAGTYYATLGRGLTLNCINETAAKTDRDLEGVLVSGALPEWADGRLLFGRIRENTVELDSSRTYAGGEVRLLRLKPVTIGGTYLRANAAGLSQDASFGKPVDELYSGTAAAAVGPVDLYAEYAGRRTYGRLFPSVGWAGIDDVNGHAVYASAALAFTGLGITVEAKDYRHFDTGINAPPPCNREGRPLNSGADEQGIAADITLSPLTGLELHGCASSAKTTMDRADIVTADGDTFPGAQKYIDLFGEARWEASSALVLRVDGQFRREDNLQSDIMRKRYKGATAGATWTYYGSRSISLKAGANQYNNIYLTERLDYNELLAELGWAPVEWLNVFATGNFANKRVAEYNDQQRWGEAGCTINFANGSQRLQVSVGQTKGGLVCSGGFCRWEPAFRGLKAAWEWKF